VSDGIAAVSNCNSRSSAFQSIVPNTSNERSKVMESFENKPSGTEDVTADFLNLSASEFNQRMRQLRNKAEVHIGADLSHITDPQEFRIKARLAKAFLESAPPGQIRNASIKATPEQVGWEPNVFSSGVELVKE